jgi:hypothetical protein
LKPANAPRFGAFAAHGFLDPRRNIRARVLNPTAKCGTLASARHGLAVHSAAEEHTNFDAIARTADRREGDECRYDDYKEGNNDSDFQIRPL